MNYCISPSTYYLSSAPLRRLNPSAMRLFPCVTRPSNSLMSLPILRLASSFCGLPLRELGLYRIAARSNLLIITNGKSLCNAFYALRNLACCAKTIDLSSYPLLLEPLHIWLPDLCHGIVVLFLVLG